MPRLTIEEAEKRRNQIIDAALRCFARQGLAHTSMSDLFDEAGMSAGSVYSWFDSKDDIIAAAYTGSGTQSAQAMAELLDHPDPLEGIGQVLRMAARLFDDEHWRMVSRVNVQLWGEALVNERVADSFLDDFRRYRSLLADAVRRAQHAGQLDAATNPEVVAYVLWGIYLGLEAQMAWEPDLAADEYVEAALDLLLPGRDPAGD